MRSRTEPRHIEIGRDFESCLSYLNRDPGRKHKLLELGERPSPGKRSDVEGIRILIRNGGGIKEVIDTATSYQSIRTGELILKYEPSTELRDVEVYWLYGKSGSGKTYFCVQAAIQQDKDFLITEGNLNQYINGYTGQKCIIFDDLRIEDISYNKLLRYLDKYPLIVNIKGTTIPLRADLIFVTSQFSPDQFKPIGFNPNEDNYQLKRRITQVWKTGTEVRGNTKAPDPENDWFLELDNL